MANLSAVLFEELPEVNWAGFYLLKGQDLVLGPFQGKPACTRIGPGKGVCGAAAAKREIGGRGKRQQVPRAYRLRCRVEIGDRRADVARTGGCSACSTSTARCWPASMTKTVPGWKRSCGLLLERIGYGCEDEDKMTEYSVKSDR